MQESVSIPVGKDQRLSGLFHGPQKKTAAAKRRMLVIMMHDFPGGHKGGQNDLFGDLQHQLGLDGHQSVRFDFRGCGESEGRSEDFTLTSAKSDLRAVRRWAAGLEYENFIYVGEGLGGLISLLSPVEELKACALLWPVIDPGLCPALDDLLTTGIGAEFVQELKALNPAEWLPQVTAPILVQHGDKDALSPYEQLDALRRYGRNSRRVEITRFEGGENGLKKLNERKTLLFQTRQFIQKYS